MDNAQALPIKDTSATVTTRLDGHIKYPSTAPLAPLSFNVGRARPSLGLEHYTKTKQAVTNGNYAGTMPPPRSNGILPHISAQSNDPRKRTVSAQINGSYAHTQPHNEQQRRATAPKYSSRQSFEHIGANEVRKRAPLVEVKGLTRQATSIPQREAGLKPSLLASRPALSTTASHKKQPCHRCNDVGVYALNEAMINCATCWRRYHKRCVRQLRPEELKQRHKARLSTIPGDPDWICKTCLHKGRRPGAALHPPKTGPRITSDTTLQAKAANNSLPIEQTDHRTSDGAETRRANTEQQHSLEIGTPAGTVRSRNEQQVAHGEPIIEFGSSRHRAAGTGGAIVSVKPMPIATYDGPISPPPAKRAKHYHDLATDPPQIAVNGFRARRRTLSLLSDGLGDTLNDPYEDTQMHVHRKQDNAAAPEQINKPGLGTSLLDGRNYRVPPLPKSNEVEGGANKHATRDNVARSEAQQRYRDFQAAMRAINDRRKSELPRGDHERAPSVTTLPHSVKGTISATEQVIEKSMPGESGQKSLTTNNRVLSTAPAPHSARAAFGTTKIIESTDLTVSPDPEEQGYPPTSHNKRKRYPVPGQRIIHDTLTDVDKSLQDVKPVTNGHTAREDAIAKLPELPNAVTERKIPYPNGSASITVPQDASQHHKNTDDTIILGATASRRLPWITVPSVEVKSENPAVSAHKNTDDTIMVGATARRRLPSTTVPSVEVKSENPAVSAHKMAVCSVCSRRTLSLNSFVTVCIDCKKTEVQPSLAPSSNATAVLGTASQQPSEAKSTQSTIKTQKPHLQDKATAQPKQYNVKQKRSFAEYEAEFGSPESHTESQLLKLIEMAMSAAPNHRLSCKDMIDWIIASIPSYIPDSVWQGRVAAYLNKHKQNGLAGSRGLWKQLPWTENRSLWIAVDVTGANLHKWDHATEQCIPPNTYCGLSGRSKSTLQARPTRGAQDETLRETPAPLGASTPEPAMTNSKTIQYHHSSQGLSRPITSAPRPAIPSKKAYQIGSPLKHSVTNTPSPRTIETTQIDHSLPSGQSNTPLRDVVKNETFDEQILQARSSRTLAFATAVPVAANASAQRSSDVLDVLQAQPKSIYDYVDTFMADVKTEASDGQRHLDFPQVILNAKKHPNRVQVQGYTAASFKMGLVARSLASHAWATDPIIPAVSPVAEPESRRHRKALIGMPGCLSRLLQVEPFPLGLSTDLEASVKVSTVSSSIYAHDPLRGVYLSQEGPPPPPPPPRQDIVDFEKADDLFDIPRDAMMSISAIDNSLEWQQFTNRASRRTRPSVLGKVGKHV